MDLLLVARFGLVGMACTVLHFAVVWAAASGLGWSLAAANAMAYGLANLFSYVMQSRFTFRARPRSGWRWVIASLLLLALAAAAGRLVDVLLPGVTFAWMFAALPVVAASFVVMRFWVFPASAVATVGVAT